MNQPLLTCCLLVFGIHMSPAAPPDAKPRLAINLAGPADWMTELPFVDVFRTARPWISQKKGAGWGQRPELAVDEFGWVKRLEPGCYAEAMLCTISGGHYPAGTYCRASGIATCSWPRPSVPRGGGLTQRRRAAEKTSAPLRLCVRSWNPATPSPNARRRR